VSVLNCIINCLTSSNAPDVSRTKVESEFVAEAVNDYLDEHAENGSRLPLDGKYYTTSEDEMKQIVNADQTDKKLYRKAEYDCENFALSFMANVQGMYGVTTIGLVIDWSGGHAYNMLVYEDGSIALYEPQNDKFVEPGDTDVRDLDYPFENVRVII